MGLCDSYVLHSNPQLYALQVADGSETLVIDRLTGEVRVDGEIEKVFEGAAVRPKQQHIFGVAGIVQLLDGGHVIAITARSKVASVAGNAIYRVDKWQLLPLARNDAHLTEEQRLTNAVYLQMVWQVLRTPDFYYSTCFDLTHSLQRRAKTSPAFAQMSLFARADSRFVWNQQLLADWAAGDGQLQKFLIPVMHGFVTQKQLTLKNGSSFEYTLISRRSVQRAGTRFNTRGADLEGNVANFVETEIIIETKVGRSSLVQTRGSIPLLWQQLPDLRYKPPPTLIPGPQEDVVRKHFEQQIVTYGQQVVVNLIDQKGAEDVLGKELGRCLALMASSQVRYEPFDFHTECKGMRYDKLKILIDRVANSQKSFSFYLEPLDGNSTITPLQQTGVFRTNCIDCLDRTNVVQSLIARCSLVDQLAAQHLINSASDLENDPVLEDALRTIWADNGDMCSLQYAGTGALKADYTRTGKRTVFGVARDGYRSCIRYIKNNFFDGQRQDGIELVLGNHRLDEVDARRQLSRPQLPPDVFLAPLVLAVLVFLLPLLIVLGPSREQPKTLLFFILVLWAPSVVFLCLKIKANRMLYVDKPRWMKPVVQAHVHGSFRR